MTIVIKKPRAVEETTPAVEKTELQILIDEVGELQKDALKTAKRIKDEQAKLKPYTEKLKELAEKVNALDLGEADQEGTLEGTAFEVEYGKKGNSREITDMAKIRKMLGDKLFFQLAKLNLGDVDAYLTPPQIEQVVKKNRTDRKVTVKPKA
jgi:hypothetical protein